MADDLDIAPTCHYHTTLYIFLTAAFSLILSMWLTFLQSQWVRETVDKTLGQVCNSRARLNAQHHKNY